MALKDLLVNLASAYAARKRVIFRYSILLTLLALSVGVHVFIWYFRGMLVSTRGKHVVRPTIEIVFPPPLRHDVVPDNTLKPIDTALAKASPTLPKLAEPEKIAKPALPKKSIIKKVHPSTQKPKKIPVASPKSLPRKNLPEPDPNLVQESLPVPVEPPSRTESVPSSDTSDVKTEDPPTMSETVSPSSEEFDQDNSTLETGNTDQQESTIGGSGSGDNISNDSVTDCSMPEMSESDYPPLAKQRQWEGEVLILALITPSGGVDHAEIKKSSGHPILDEAALEATRDSLECKPFLKDGKPIERWVTKPFRFRLPE